MDYRILFDLRDALLCLGFLGGMGGAVFLFARNQRTAGALTLAAFALFGIDPLIELILYRIMMSLFPTDNYDAFNWVYFCISTPAILLGVAAIVAALVVAVRSPESQSAE